VRQQFEEAARALGLRASKRTSTRHTARAPDPRRWRAQASRVHLHASISPATTRRAYCAAISANGRRAAAGDRGIPGRGERGAVLLLHFRPQRLRRFRRRKHGFAVRPEQQLENLRAGDAVLRTDADFAIDAGHEELGFT
jgi:hypothetical protein